MDPNNNLKERIERVLSDILSEKYDCKVTLHFEKKGDNNNEENCN